MSQELYIKRYSLFLIPILSISLSLLQAQSPQNNAGRSDTTRIQRENDIYPLRTVPIPQDIPLEVGGMNFNMKPFAAGFRSPAAFALNEAGDIFYAENQGDWVGSGNVTHVEEGDFLGNPRSLRWSGEPGSPVKLKIDDIPDTGEPKYEI